MITFPIAKINLGLNIVEKREDGYHNLETVFYPININDAIEIYPMHDGFPSDVDCDLKISNISIEGNEQNNLVVRAYNMLKNAGYDLPRIHTHLYKGIPTQAGMGGGSSDCAYMLKLLNEEFKLNISKEDLIRLSAKLGADCPFFILSKPAYAEGIGEVLTPISLDLSNYYIAIVRPDIPVSTCEAFSLITPKPTSKKCKDIVKQPIETWRNELINDFEYSVFSIHPELSEIKNKLYEMGALYAAMSGSGSSIFGIFEKPININEHFPNMFTYTSKL